MENPKAEIDVNEKKSTRGLQKKLNYRNAGSMRIVPISVKIRSYHFRSNSEQQRESILQIVYRKTKLDKSRRHFTEKIYCS